MWVLKFLPNWIFYLLFFIGVAGIAATYLLRFIPIPAIYMYKTPIQLVSIALVIIGTFMAGAIHDNEAWEARVRELEAKLAEAATQSAKENVKIVEKVVTKTQVIKEKAETNTQYIDREIVKYNNICEVPKEFIQLHNSAAEAPK
jgi:predicted membrane chloride channel (bestrophin family)